MNSAANPNELLQAFELTDQIIANAGKLPWTNSILPALVDRRKEMVVELEELTRPHERTLSEILADRRARLALQPQAPLSREPKTGYFYKNEFYPCAYYLEMYRKLLKRLFMDFPEKRENMACSVRWRRCTRRFIADQREILFHNSKDLRWVRKHSKTLVDGWYIDNNVMPDRINKILPQVVRAAGLVWETDVLVIW